MIHPTAVIHPRALIDSSVVVGPYAVIDEGVTIGARCTIGPHVHITGNTSIGASNHIHTGAVLGDAPQDLKYDGQPTRLRIGSHNVIREHVTIHRSTKVAEETRIGSHNLLMAHCHVGHNVILGDLVIIANGALLGGYVTVEDRAFISGNCLVHQFVTVGMLALMQGGAAISKDLPPFTVARGDNAICGLNVVGLRRAGYGLEQRRELKRLYHILFRGPKNLGHALAEVANEPWGEGGTRLISFVRQSKRGVCQDSSYEADGSDPATP
jgi:UDP-N-acetylglucosamine acyltransferase